MRTWIEPVVAGSQLASSFYETGLLLVVKGYYNRTSTLTNSSSEDVLQKSISNFYIIYNLIIKLTPLPSAYILAKIGDKGKRKIALCVPLVGLFMSNVCLLFINLWEWPIQVMFGTAAFNGLCGWFMAYWPAVMTLASLDSSPNRRSLRLIITECTFGLAGFIGSLISGHVFVYQVANRPGILLTLCSIASYAFCLLYVTFILKTPQGEVIQIEDHISKIATDPAEDDAPTERSKLLNEKPAPRQTYMTSSYSKLTVYLLFLSATLYNAAVNGNEDVINFFVLKKPLSWGPVEVGYGNAAAYMIFITSFFGVFVFSKCLQDLSLVIFGMISFFVGVLVMAFVRWTFLYYIARVVMMFSLIPVPTIRAILSKATKESTYGKVFALLQMIMGVVSVATSTAFIAIYQVTLDWFSGFSFIVISVVTFISLIPISIIACKTYKTSGSHQTQDQDDHNESFT